MFLNVWRKRGYRIELEIPIIPVYFPLSVIHKPVCCLLSVEQSSAIWTILADQRHLRNEKADIQDCCLQEKAKNTVYKEADYD